MKINFGMPDYKVKYKLEYIDSYDKHHEVYFQPLEYKHLMELIWDRAIEDWGDCKGRAWCGTCHVAVKKSLNVLPKYDTEENHCLSHQINREESSRLACQLMLTKALDGAVITYLGDT